jgi:hypothetical protein
MHKLIITAIVSASLTVAAGYAYTSMSKSQTSPSRTAQSFRFGEQCPDGLRVEYVNTFRLPRAVVCQQPVGE